MFFFYLLRSDKINSNMPESVANAIAMQQFKSSAFSNISVADMLAARQDLALIDKVRPFRISDFSQNNWSRKYFCCKMQLTKKFALNYNKNCFV